TNHFSTFAVFEAEAIDSDSIVVKDNESSEQAGESDDDPEATIIDDNDASTDVANDEKVTTEKDTTALLPNTATNMYNFLFYGLSLLLAGVSIFAMRRF